MQKLNNTFFARLVFGVAITLAILAVPVSFAQSADALKSFRNQGQAKITAKTTVERSQEHSNNQRFWRTTMLNSALVGSVYLYGLQYWEYGEATFHTGKEGWLGKDTKSGGADKFGHSYSAGLVTALTSSLYRSWGYKNKRAAELGALSGLLLTTAMEIGDGYSTTYGYSWEDQAFNFLGVGLEYMRLAHPTWNKRVQFRWEYIPTPEVRSGREKDIFTDYSGSRWVLSFPLNGWGARTGLLSYLELLAGYGTRGYQTQDLHYYDEKRRYPFVGISLNVSRLLGLWGASPSTRRIFEYVQVPFTALPFPPDVQ